MNLGRLLCFVGRHDMMRWRTSAGRAAIPPEQWVLLDPYMNVLASPAYRVRRCRRCSHTESAPVRTPAVRKRQLQEASDAAVRG